MTAPTLFRIERIAVPAEALSEFLPQAERAVARLRQAPGCLQARLLGRTGEPQGFNLMTLVEWTDEASLVSAKAAMDRQHADEGFDPAAFRQRLGVRAEPGVFS